MRLALICLWLLMATGFASPPAVSASTVKPQAGTVAALMAKMTPEEKVGQLFLVTFYGPTADEGTDIQNLIVNYHIGGVSLVAANDNITVTTNAPQAVLTLVNQLQSDAITATETETATTRAKTPFIPLLIAINHEGAGYP